MNGGKIGSLVAAGSLLIATSAAATTPTAASGIASNRAALGLPIGTTEGGQDCTPTKDAPCPPDDSTDNHRGTGTLLVALAAIAAVGGGIAAAAGHGNHVPVSP